MLQELRPSSPYGLIIVAFGHPLMNGTNFGVFSCDNAGQWTEHCRGLVSVEYHKTWSDVEGDREAELKLASHCDKLTSNR